MRIFPFILLFLSVNCFSAISIISDLDDTIKITNAGNSVMASYNGIIKTKVFTGMPEFLEDSRSYIDELTILSTSPSFIRPMVMRNFSEHDIDVDRVILKKKIWKGSYSFKVSKIKDILENSLDDFILLGDDVNADVEVFESIIKLYPRRVTAAYIHVVKGKKLPPGITPYFTAFDLAVRENLAGRMSEKAVIELGTVISSETRMDRIFPKFAECPQATSTWDWTRSTIWKELSYQVASKLTAYCSKTK